MTRPIIEPSTPQQLTYGHWRTSQLERRSGGSWIEVLDPDLTSSGEFAWQPFFENGWMNIGPPWTPCRFRWRMETGLPEIEGVVTGGAVDTVVFTLPAGPYQRDFDIPLPGVDPITFLPVAWLILATGGVIFKG